MPTLNDHLMKQESLHHQVYHMAFDECLTNAKLSTFACHITVNNLTSIAQTFLNKEYRESMSGSELRTSLGNFIYEFWSANAQM